MYMNFGKNKSLWINTPKAMWDICRNEDCMSIPASIILTGAEMLSESIWIVVGVVDHLFTKRSNGVVVNRRN